MGTGLFLEGY